MGTFNITSKSEGRFTVIVLRTSLGVTRSGVKSCLRSVLLTARSDPLRRVSGFGVQLGVGRLLTGDVSCVLFFHYKVGPRVCLRAESFRGVQRFRAGRLIGLFNITTDSVSRVTLNRITSAVQGLRVRRQGRHAFIRQGATSCGIGGGRRAAAREERSGNDGRVRRAKELSPTRSCGSEKEKDSP